MIRELEHEETMVDYLLGRLSPEEGARLEERCLADDAFFDRMLEAENDLVDNYLRGRLSQREKERFESHYLASPERREKVEFARAFLHTVAQAPPVAGKQPSRLLAWWESVRDSFRGRGFGAGLSWATAAVIIALGALWFVRETGLRRELAQFQERQAALERQEQDLRQQIAAQRGNIEQLNSDLDRVRQQRQQIEAEMNKSRQSTLAAATFTLGLGGGRTIGQAKLLEIPPKTDVVRLQIFEIDEYARYTAVLRTLPGQTPAGEKVWSQKGLKSQLIDRAVSVILEIPAARLGNRGYHLTLSGITAGGETEKAGEYYFTVRKK